MKSFFVTGLKPNFPDFIKFDYSIIDPVTLVEVHYFNYDVSNTKIIQKYLKDNNICNYKKNTNGKLTNTGPVTI